MNIRAREREAQQLTGRRPLMKRSNLRRLYIILSNESPQDDFVRELPSKVDDGGVAILGFTSRREAESRAAKHFGYESYGAAHRDGWCEVVAVGE